MINADDYSTLELRELFKEGVLKTRDIEYVFTTNESIDLCKKLCSFYSPNIKKVQVTSKHHVVYPNRILFSCERFVGGDSVLSLVSFDFDFYPLRISNYERQYLK